jgi:hypothetical protein
VDRDAYAAAAAAARRKQWRSAEANCLDNITAGVL